MGEHIRILRRLGACSDAIEFAKTRPDLRSAWETCERGDWLLWLAVRVGVDRKLVVGAACECAETALRYVPAGEERPKKALETARAWAKGDATIEQVRFAAYAAAAACAAADDAYAAAYAAAAAAAHAAAADAAMSRVHAASLLEYAESVRASIAWSVVSESIGRL